MHAPPSGTGVAVGVAVLVAVAVPVAVEVLRELAIDQVDAVGLAKMRVTRDARASEIERSDERVFLPGRVNPVVLRRNSNALFLLQRLRDEAHRFAITYHRSLRGKERLRSLLDSVPGVGAERRRRRLAHRLVIVPHAGHWPGIDSFGDLALSAGSLGWNSIELCRDLRDEPDTSATASCQDEQLILVLPPSTSVRDVM